MILLFHRIFQIISCCVSSQNKIRRMGVVNLQKVDINFTVRTANSFVMT